MRDFSIRSQNDLKGLDVERSSIMEWTAPPVPEDIPCGDMPGDSIRISGDHIRKADTVFPILMRKLMDIKESRQAEGRPMKAVVSVYGGSGVGKSETASVLSFYLREAGIGAYTMSGDNYPHRIPKYNDMERARVYEEGGEQALKAYLGSELEINFKEVNEIIRLFKSGEDTIHLRRMGRSETELWYEPVDLSGTEVMVLEWTHGNNAELRGVDIPVFLASTPAETLAHRIARNRDGDPDSPFVTMVLGMEQDLLTSQVGRAEIVISKQGDLISAEEYLDRIRNEK